MSLQANKKSIAAFIVGALSVGFVMTFSFGGSEVFSRQATFLMYFDDSVNGVDTTSLVKYRGVPIGYVQSLMLHFNQLPFDRKVPIFIRVDVQRLRRQLNLVADLNDPTVLEQQIKAGLRGKLEVESYVTGQMYVDLSYIRNAPKPPTLAFESDYPVIPTLTSESSRIIERVEAMTRALGSFDYQGFVALINSKLDLASQKVAGIAFAEYNQKALDMLAPLQTLDSAQWHSKFVKVLSNLERYGAMAKVSRGPVISMSANIIGLGQARSSVETFQANLASLQRTLQPEGEFRQQMDQMLVTLTNLVSSWRQKADNLQEKP
jgi:paraquat-inducible protein B